MTDEAGVELANDNCHLAYGPVGDRAYDAATDYWVGLAGGRGIFVHRSPSDRATPLREALRLVNDTDLMVVMRAAELVVYHANHPYCPRCGSATEVVEWGRARHCPACGAEHFPRIDPAIIVAITDDNDRLLLGHHADWEPARYSLFAGFVEAGESPEQTVVREVAEEVGLDVSDITYQGAQPWPGPRSLMLSYHAHGNGDPRPDGQEILAARWFSRDQLTQSVARGDIVLPPASSVAYRLITGWQNGGAAVPLSGPTLWRPTS